jgi:hypothetical protein
MPVDILQKKLGDVFRMLKTRGFSATGNRSGIRSFEGMLSCTKGPVRIQLKVSDWDFLSFPSITILERPSFLLGLIPHVDTAGVMCYFAPGSVILDRYNPASAIDQCLDQATLVLNQITCDSAYRVNEIRNEFAAYWALGVPQLEMLVFIGRVGSNSIRSTCFIFNNNGIESAIISDSHAAVEAIVRTLGWPTPITKTLLCWTFCTDNLPPVPQDSMPLTIKKLFAWIYQWDRNIFFAINSMLERKGDYLDHPKILFAVKCPIGWVGFGFNLDGTKRIYCRRSPKWYKKYLCDKGGLENIFGFQIIDISPSFVHSRNLSFSNLEGRHIMLVGCGAIGGYLAQAIVRLGAGLGSGSLTLIDPDLLQPENLGRHHLGYTDLFQMKAKALCNDLQRQFPLAQITYRTHGVTFNNSTFTADLVIDATGEEAVSEMLNGGRIICGSSASPVLHVWIKGNGECVQSFWADQSGYGCFRCLRMTDSDHRYRQERFPILINPPAHKSVGCHAFTPYAVSAPMHAASLATDIIIDWLKGDPSPRFRTRIVENANTLEVQSQNISRLEKCPACGHQ